MDATKRLEEYRTLFCVANHRTIKEKGVQCGIHNTTTRSLAWKLYLEVLPPYVSYTEWPARLHEMRKEYRGLCNKHIVDPRSLQPQTSTFFDPLSTTNESPWNKFFQNIELEKEIKRDLERTYPEYPFFQLPQVQAALRRVLFIYSREHPNISYRQGMHELLAPIFFVLWEDVHGKTASGPVDILSSSQLETPPSEEKPITGETSTLLEYPPVTPTTFTPISTEQEAIDFFFDANFIEHDAFLLFTNLMNSTAEFFMMPTPSKPPPKDLFAEKSTPADQSEALTPVVRRCIRIQNILLKQKDPSLFEHFSKLQIEPQLYALRWLKLLFGREFKLRDLTVLWDAIFAYGRSCALVDFICVAMLIYIRTELLQLDQVTAMRRLLRYPPVEDITLFVEMAVSLGTPKKPSQPVASTTTSPIAVLHQQTQAQHPLQTPPQNTASAATSTTPTNNTHPLNSNPVPSKPSLAAAAATVATQFRATVLPIVSPSSPTSPPSTVANAALEENKHLQAQVQALKLAQQHTATRLERVVFAIQAELASRPDLANIEPLVDALAELKRIQAINSGLLTEDS
ncbi:TBC1 domain family protein [Pelomyxa schiedti]|nr:TBC1 domain family protein [Pelomyxa schiedti]